MKPCQILARHINVASAFRLEVESHDLWSPLLEKMEGEEIQFRITWVGRICDLELLGNSTENQIHLLARWLACSFCVFVLLWKASNIYTHSWCSKGTQRSLYTERRSVYTPKPLRRKAFSPRSLSMQNFYKQELLHREACIYSNFIHKRFFAKKLLHTESFSQSSVYTEQLLHTEAFTQRGLYTGQLLRTETLTHRCPSFYTQELLHTHL